MTKNKIRCPWTGSDQLMIDYHDTEWGIPVHDDKKWFEFLLLEAFQAGLSWKTVLHKRANFRRAFDEFDYLKIADYSGDKIAELLNNKGIIRNKLKIHSTISNAKAFIQIINQLGSFDQFIWQFTEGKSINNNWEALGNIPASTLLIGQAKGLDGLEIGGFMNMEKDFSTGSQIAGFGNLVGGDFEGFQCSGFMNINNGSFKGAQVGGFMNINKKEFEGVQIGGFLNSNGNATEGIQCAGFLNLAEGSGDLIQIGGFANITKGEINGIQTSGFINTCKGNSEILQIAGFANVAENVDGVQLSGFINTAKLVKGVQIAGFINVCDSIDGIPIAFLSFAKQNGYSAFELSSNNTLFLNGSWKTGVRQFYNILTVGYRPGRGNNWGFGYGIGTDIRISEVNSICIEAVSYHINEASIWTNKVNLLNQLRVNYNFGSVDAMKFFAGPTYNIFITDPSFQKADIVPSWAIRYGGYNNNVWGWFGINAGFRF